MLRKLAFKKLSRVKKKLGELEKKFLEWSNIWTMMQKLISAGNILDTKTIFPKVL